VRGRSGGTAAALLLGMQLEPDRARNVCALLALYFAFCSLYALGPYVATGSLAAATAFGLVGLWFALVAAFDVLAGDGEGVSVQPSLSC
jgi:hypothetical protein